MRKENRSGSMGGGEEREDCDVGLGLKVQSTESFPSREIITMGFPNFSPYHHHHHHSSSGFGGFSGGDGGPTYRNPSERLSCVSDVYDVVGGGSVSSFKSSDTVKVPFTEIQREELERQTMIYKYMMASIPVPPQLLIPPIIKRSPQSNMSGLNLRFSSGSDPEPWRCRRTDGKKWRCSRDVTPDQKYCERHTHKNKNKNRSRKPVESQPAHTTTTTTATAAAAAANYLNNTHYSPTITNVPAITPTAQAFLNPTIHFPNAVSGATYNQTRPTEWFMKGETNPVSALNQQWHQVMPSSSSSRLGLKRDNTYLDKNVCEEQEPFNLNSHMGIGDSQRFHNRQLNDPKLTQLPQGISSNAEDQTQKTRYFFDAFSEIGNKCSVSSSSGKLPLSSSLTLSMSGGNGIDEETENSEMGIGSMMESEREGDDEGFRSQWLLNPISWIDSPPPGGPLGEALCLGIASNAKTASNLPSPRGGYSNSTTTSSCSKGSYEESDHGLHFLKRQ